LLGKSALADGQTSADGQVVVSVGSVVDMVVDLEEEIVVEEATEVAAGAKAEKEKQNVKDLKLCIILFDRLLAEREAEKEVGTLVKPDGETYMGDTRM